MDIKKLFLTTAIALTVFTGYSQSKENKKTAKKDSISKAESKILEKSVEEAGSYIVKSFAKPFNRETATRKRLERAKIARDKHITASAFIDAEISENKHDAGIKQKIYNENDPEFLKQMKSQLDNWMEQEHVVNDDHNPRDGDLNTYLDRMENAKELYKNNPKAITFLDKQEDFIQDRLKTGDKTIGDIYDYIKSLQKNKPDYSPKN